ncbi:rnhA operon protein [Natrarchaeobius sp. A-rgal3]|uniref:DUF7108 family protein n=1 Tax=Natrarchaeobius versutus TaxID=1679078 RepID=UPI00350F3F6D
MSDLDGPNGSSTDPQPDDADASGTGDDEVPADVVREVERLTRIARSTPDDNEARARERRREKLLTAYGFTARVREDDTDAVLVLYPDEWREDGVVRTERIEDVSRAVEVSLEGAGDPDDWSVVDEHNRELAARVGKRHGDVHGANATALADFVGNHYAKRIESLTGPELSEFCTEYFVRNAWPSQDQRGVVEESIELVYETAEEPVPEFRIR